MPFYSVTAFWAPCGIVSKRKPKLKWVVSFGFLVTPSKKGALKETHPCSSAKPKVSCPFHHPASHSGAQIPPSLSLQEGRALGVCFGESKDGQLKLARIPSMFPSKPSVQLGWCFSWTTWVPRGFGKQNSGMRHKQALFPWNKQKLCTKRELGNPPRKHK